MKQIFLTLSAGRSGTQKLSKLLSQIPNTYAEHEGTPGFETVRIPNLKTPSVGAAFVKDKLAYWNSLPQNNIAHTGHIAGLGFYDHILDQGIVPNIIILRRPMREVALSMYKLNWIPGLVKLIDPWYCSPAEEGVLEYPDWKTAHPYQLCYWWCLDSEQRIQHYKYVFEAYGSKIHETTLAGILDIRCFNNMLTRFGLQNVAELSTERVNNYEAVKHFPVHKDIPPLDYLTKLEAEVVEKTGYELPTIQTVDVESAAQVTTEVFVNTCRFIAYSVRESDIRTSAYIKPLSLEL
jgi:hypothetical protein